MPPTTSASLAPTAISSEAKLYFVNTRNDTILYNFGIIVNGATYSYRRLGSYNISIVVEPQSTAISQVIFKWPGREKIEQARPFSMNGNSVKSYAEVPYLGKIGFKEFRIETYFNRGAKMFSAFNATVRFTMAE